MLRKFQKYIQKHKITTAQQTTLLAVSGGIDSVTLCHLFHQSGLPFVIAHCNFQLRGSKSEEDEQFVHQLAQHYRVQYYKIAFDTENISTKEKTSIQIIARELRYEWFQKLMVEHSYHQLATAHHMNDRIETFLYNFTKGTGIRGLRNMRAKTGNIVRPLLFASKAEILAYAKTHNLNYRTDLSNLSTKYNRNKLRIKAIPVLKDINPALEKTSIATFQNLEETEALFLWAIQSFREKLVLKKDGHTHIDLLKLRESPAPQSILFEILSPYGFSLDQVRNILNKQTKASGAQFVTTDFRLIKNRNELIITKNETSEKKSIQIQDTDKLVNINDLNITITKTNDLPTEFSKSNNSAWFDCDKLVFPLTIRPWQAGDFFHPIGMKGQKQKVKKYLTNEKLSLVQKENVNVLLSKEEICWVVGYRMDDRFKLNDKTKNAICFRIR